MVEDLRISRGGLVDLLKSGDHVLVASLIRDGVVDVNVKDGEGRTPLHWVAYKGQSDLVFSLIWNGAEVNREDNYGDTPLHWAAKYGHYDPLLTLIERGANVNAINKVGRTPLHMACQNGHKLIISVLLKSRAHLEAATIEGMTPLHLACCYGNEDAAITLIQNGANIRAIDEEKWTPLHFASLNCNKHVVRWLVRHGARVNFASDDGGTPLHRVAGMHSTTRQMMVETDQSPVLQRRRQNESNIDDVNKDRNDVTRILIANGADWDLTDHYGKTALDFAIDNGQMDVAMILEHAQSNKFSKSLEKSLAEIVNLTRDIKNQFARLDSHRDDESNGNTSWQVPAKQRRKSPLTTRSPTTLPTPLYSPAPMTSPIIESPMNSPPPTRPTTLNVVGPLSQTTTKTLETVGK